MSAGDSVTLTIRNCTLDCIDATSNEMALTGVVKSIVSDESVGLSWIIQDNLEERHSLTVDPAASAYQGSKF